MAVVKMVTVRERFKFVLGEAKWRFWKKCKEKGNSIDLLKNMATRLVLFNALRLEKLVHSAFIFIVSV